MYIIFFGYLAKNKLSENFLDNRLQKSNYIV